MKSNKESKHKEHKAKEHKSNGGEIASDATGGDEAIDGMEGMNEDASEGRDMSHVEEMMDGLDDEEAAHAHKHLSKRMAEKEPKKVMGEDINDYSEYAGE